MLIPLFDFKGFFVVVVVFCNSDYKRQSAIQCGDSLPHKLVLEASRVGKGS